MPIIRVYDSEENQVAITSEDWRIFLGNFGKAKFILDKTGAALLSIGALFFAASQVAAFKNADIENDTTKSCVLRLMLKTPHTGNPVRRDFYIQEETMLSIQGALALHFDLIARKRVENVFIHTPEVSFALDSFIFCGYKK